MADLALASVKNLLVPSVISVVVFVSRLKTFSAVCNIPKVFLRLSNLPSLPFVRMILSSPEPISSSCTFIFFGAPAASLISKSPSALIDNTVSTPILIEPVETYMSLTFFVAEPISYVSSAIGNR